MGDHFASSPGYIFSTLTKSAPFYLTTTENLFVYAKYYGI